MTSTNKHGVDHEELSMQELPDDWDDDYTRVWQRWHETQDKLREERCRKKLLENKLKEAADFIQKLGLTIDYPIIDEIRELLK